MPVMKLLLALTLMAACVISVPLVDARSLRKASPSVVVGDDVGSRDAVVKRSAASERLTSRRTYSTPALAGIPVLARRGGGPRTAHPAAADAWLSPSNGDERSQFASLLADVILLERLRHRRPAAYRREAPWQAPPFGQPDDEDPLRSLQRAEGLVYGRDGIGLAEAELPKKRTSVHLRSPRELHPVYLGLGQSAASAALDTYASLLADEKRRENLEQQQQSSANPVRFIGKR